MNRAFTLREKILLVILAVLLLGCFYYVAVLQPSANALTTNQIRIDEIQSETTIQQAVAMRKADLERQIAAAEASGDAGKTLPSYDNTKNEITELNSILAEANTYDIRFSDVVPSDTIVRRGVDVSFTTESYAAAEAVLMKLINCRYSCLVTDIAIEGEALGQATSTGEVSASVAVTFFEAK